MLLRLVFVLSFARVYDTKRVYIHTQGERERERERVLLLLSRKGKRGGGVTKKKRRSLKKSLQNGIKKREKFFRVFSFRVLLIFRVSISLVFWKRIGLDCT